MGATTTQTKSPQPIGNEDCVGRRWTFEYKVPIPEESQDLTNTEQVPPQVQELLKVAACLESLDKRLVSAALSENKENQNVSDCLSKAAELGLIIEHDSKEYSFLNSETQEAAYALIPQDEQARFHLSVGRKLAMNLTQEELESNTYIILRQFHRGMEEMASRNEKKAIASLCRSAAQQAVAESNFVAASMYLEFGITLMGKDPWQNDYDLTLTLYSSSAEVEYCLANFDMMDQHVTQVLEHAHSFRDSLLVRATRVYSLGGRGRTIEAVQEGMDILQQLGISFPKRATKLHVAYELFKSRKLLRGKTNEMILRGPLMTDSDMIAAMQMMNLVFPNVFKTDPYLAFLVSSRMVTLSLEQGLCVISSVAFSMYGTMYCAYTAHKEEGYRFGQLALALLDRFDCVQWLPRVYFSVYGNINRQRHRQLDLVGPLHHGYIVGMDTGDIEFAMLNASLHVMFMLFGGTPLPELEAHAIEYMKVMESHQQVSALTKTRSILRFAQNLMGKTDDPLKMGDESFNEEVASARANNLLTVWYHFQKMILRYLLLDYDGAETHAVSFRDLRKYLHFKSSYGFISLIEGLALLAVCNNRPRKTRRQHLSVARANIKQLKNEAMYNPQDIAGKVFLLEAELARVMGKNDVARYNYQCAVALTRESGISLDHALACERTSRYMSGIGDTATATEYLKQACASYGEWGASYKVEQLQTELLTA